MLQKQELKRYVTRGSIAFLITFPVLLLLRETNLIIISSIGSTAFIVFTMPKRKSAEPRHVIGGHIVGIVSGFLAIFIPQTNIFLTVLSYSVAIGISISLMMATDTVHPPASGTALGVALEGFNPLAALGAISAAFFLALARQLLNNPGNFNTFERK